LGTSSLLAVSFGSSAGIGSGSSVATGTASFFGSTGALSVLLLSASASGDFYLGDLSFGDFLIVST